MLEDTEARLLRMLESMDENFVLRAAELLIQIESTRAFHRIPVRSE